MAAVRAKLPFSERRACRLLGVSRTVLHYAPVKRDEVLQRRLVDLAGERRRFGYRRLHILLEREGFFVNHKRVHRLYRKAGLAVRKRKKRYRRRTGHRQKYTRIAISQIVGQSDK